MPKRILIFLIIILSFPTLILGQQDPQFSQYFFSQLYYNPAVASMETSPQVQLLHRSQYLGYQSNFDNSGVLNTQMLSIQLPLAKLKSGVGLVILNDQAGLQKNQQLRLSYAKNIKVNTGSLSLGVSAGFYNKSFDNNFRPRESNDPNIPANGYSQLRPDFGIGINYTAKSYFARLSLNHLNNPKFDYGAQNGNNIINRNLAALVGINLPINAKIDITPNILFRSDLQTYHFEGGILANVSQKHWFGINYRSQDAIILLAGTSLLKDNSLKLGVSYDFVTESQPIKSASSFEVMAKYSIGQKSKSAEKIPTKSPIIRTPRYRH